MRIHEIINESTTCTPGWQDSDEIKSETGGYSILSVRRGTDCEIDEILFVYYDKNQVINDTENQFGWLSSVKVKNKRVIVYNYFLKGEEGTDIGEYLSIGQIKKIFDDLTSQHTT